MRMNESSFIQSGFLENIRRTSHYAEIQKDQSLCYWQITEPQWSPIFHLYYWTKPGTVQIFGLNFQKQISTQQKE